MKCYLKRLIILQFNVVNMFLHLSITVLVCVYLLIENKKSLNNGLGDVNRIASYNKVHEQT